MATGGQHLYLVRQKSPHRRHDLMETDLKTLKEDLLDKLELAVLEKLEKSIAGSQVKTSTEWVAIYQRLMQARKGEGDLLKEVKNETAAEHFGETIQSLGSRQARVVGARL
jgi:hypothetical protein